MSATMGQRIAGQLLSFFGFIAIIAAGLIVTMVCLYYASMMKRKIEQLESDQDRGDD